MSERFRGFETSVVFMLVDAGVFILAAAADVLLLATDVLLLAAGG
jgi:hypothetical protein